VEIYPAIDIRAGRVVRASRTDPARATPYHPDPITVAESYAASGARWIHVVDLDRAFGVGQQDALMAALVKRLPIPVQAGGGLWTADAVGTMRDCGVQRILLGARAVADEATLEEMTELFAADSLGLALDVDHGRAWSRDWPDASQWTPEALVNRAAAAGIGVVAVTDLEREGKLEGAAVAEAAALARRSGVEVIVSGGVDSLEDLVRIREAALAGAIVGRALLERRFTVEEALACCSRSS